MLLNIDYVFFRLNFLKLCGLRSCLYLISEFPSYDSALTGYCQDATGYCWSVFQSCAKTEMNKHINHQTLINQLQIEISNFEIFKLLQPPVLSCNDVGSVTGMMTSLSLWNAVARTANILGGFYEG